MICIAFESIALARYFRIICNVFILQQGQKVMFCVLLQFIIISTHYKGGIS